MNKILIIALAAMAAFSAPAVAQDLSASEMAEMHAQRLQADRSYAGRLTFADIAKMPTYSPYEGLESLDPARDPWRKIAGSEDASVDFDRDGRADQVGLYRNSQQYAVIVRFGNTERRPLLIYKAAGTGENVNIVSAPNAVLVSQSDTPGPILYMKDGKAVAIERGMYE